METSPLAPQAVRLLATMSAVAKAASTVSVATAPSGGVGRSGGAPRGRTAALALTDDVLRYLETKEPSLAALVALMHSPVGMQRPGELHMALALRLTKVCFAFFTPPPSPGGVRR